MLIFANDFQKRNEERFKKRQLFIDSECLRYMEQYIPIVSGNLVQSGIRGSELGTGVLQYDTPYAKKVYYSKKPIGRANGSLRGGMFFERMKRDKKDLILQGVNKL